MQWHSEPLYLYTQKPNLIGTIFLLKAHWIQVDWIHVDDPVTNPSNTIERGMKEIFLRIYVYS